MGMTPLADPRPRGMEPPQDPMHRHAEIWAHVQRMPPAALEQHVATMDYALPIMGVLANNPKVRPKDVIKAVADAVAQRKIDPSKGVAFISQMPADQEKLWPWLKKTYQDNLTATVHAKAMLMAMGEPGSPGGPQPDGMPEGQQGGGMQPPMSMPGKVPFQ